MVERSDANKLVGMSGWLALEDIEEACTTLRGLGFDGVGVFHTQVASRLISAPLYEGQFRAAGDVVREAGLVVSTLNVIKDRDEFDPLGSDESMEAAVTVLSRDLKMAAVMGAPGILIWDGRVDDERAADSAPARIAECIVRARDASGLSDPPEISIELHPFTFALRYRRVAEFAEALKEVGAGLCVDFCHFAVALGPDFIEVIDDGVMAAVNEIHYSDSDCVTSEFHMPPGRGILDMARIADRFRGRRIPASWDLFQWPAPRAAVREYMPGYQSFVAALSEAP
jgi:sugar phosphate isomerase/epimerase